METVPSRPTQPPGYPWRIFWVLLVASVAGVAAVLPYVFALFRTLISTRPLSMPPLVLVALLVMNGIALLVFGYLYWKRGLEAAMLAHFSADFTLHVIGPMFLRT